MKGTNILCMPVSRQSSWRVAEEVSLKIVLLYNAPLISHRQLFKITGCECAWQKLDANSSFSLTHIREAHTCLELPLWCLGEGSKPSDVG